MSGSTLALPSAFARQRGVLPGYRLALGITVVYLSLVVVLPLAALAFRAAAQPLAGFWEAVSGPRALAAFRLSFGASLGAAGVNTVCGLAVAWVLTRYRFPLRSWVDALVDLPFALPTSVAGIALTTLCTPHGWIGRWAAEHGVKIAFTPLGVGVALIFVGLPFGVRTLQPVLLGLDPHLEEAAAVLGASRARTFFQVLLPLLAPALLTAFTLSFARALGEYGSVVFISGNLPLKTEIVPLLIVTKLDQYDYAGATALAVVMLAASFGVLLASNVLHARWVSRRRA